MTSVRSRIIATTIASLALLVAPVGVAFAGGSSSSIDVQSVSLNGTSMSGVNSITVPGSATISASVTVKLQGSASWHSTSWRIGNSGSYACVDTTDKDSAGTYTQTFNVTAPAGSGTYNVSFIAYEHNSCGSTSDSFSHSNGVIVQNLSNQTITVTTPAPANAPYGSTFPVAATGGGSGNPVTITTSGSCTGSGSGSANITVTSGTGTCTVNFNQAGNGSYNAAPQVVETSTDTKAALTITANSTTKNYGDTVTFAGTEFTNSTLVAGDSVTSLTLTSTGAVSTALVSGSPYAIVPSAAVGTGLSNYTITYVNGTLTVSKKDVNVTAVGVNKAYDGTTAATVVPTVNGALGGDDVSTTYTATFATSSVGTAIPVSVTAIALAGSDAGNYNLTNTTTMTSANITGSAATVQLDPAGQNLNPTYDGTPKPLTFSTTPNGLTLDITYNGSATAPTDAGIYTVVATIVDANYSGSDTVTLTIGKATPAITVTPYSVTYNGVAHTATSTATGVGAIDLSGSLNLSATVHTNAGSYATDAWTFTGGTNYTDENGTVNDEIAQANAVISVTPYLVTFDGDPHTATGTATGVLGEDLGSELGLSGTTHTATGTYPEDPWTFSGDDNYAATEGTVNDAITDVQVFTLTYTAGANGSITGVSPQGVTSGQDGTAVTAVAASGFHFVNWSDSSTNNPRTDTDVTGNISVTANFAADSSSDSNPSPSVSSSGSSGGGGGGGGGNGPISGGFGGFTGQVLGASTSTIPTLACNTPLLTTFMRLGKHNDVSEVEKLQKFLNDQMQANLPITGFFGPSTDKAVRNFQAKYPDQTLTPWTLNAPTGFVYLTTQRWINLLYCQSLNIPIPPLVPYSGQ